MAELVVYKPGNDPDDVAPSRAALWDDGDLWGESEYGPRCENGADTLRKLHATLGSTAAWATARSMSDESWD